MSGFFLIAVGYLRLGTYIKFIPYPVTVGFTAGIGVIIFASQLRDLFGLTLDGPEPGELLQKLNALVSVANTVSPQAVAVAFSTIAIILLLKRFRPGWPVMLIAIAGAAVCAAMLALDVETIGSRFGGIPRTLPWPSLPDMSFDKVQAVLPDAIAFTLLGAIESLLSAVVADGMTGRRVAVQRRNFVLDFSQAPFLDSTAANVIEGAARKARRTGMRVFLTGASPAVRRTLIANGVRPPLVRYKSSIERAMQQLRSEDADPA